MESDRSNADRVKDVLGEFLKRDPKDIVAEHGLQDDLGLDSMATIELLYEIEDNFDLQIPNEDLQGLRTVADVIAYVDSQGGGASTT